MYKVIHEFLDLQDNNHLYHVGDDYPRNGSKTTLDRTTELMGKNNKIGKPVIEYIADEPNDAVEELTSKDVKKSQSKSRKVGK